MHPADVLTKGNISTKDFFPQILGTILRINISADNKRFLVFSLPTHFLRRDNGAVWLSHIAINLFATQTGTQPKQTKSLQSLTHFFVFFKTILAIPNLAHSCFSLSLQNPNKLNFLRTKIMCASHIFCACAFGNIKRATGVLYFFILKSFLFKIE